MKTAPEIQIVLVLFVLMLLCTLRSLAQFVDPREAKEYFKHRNYAAAIKIYNKLLKKEPNNADYNYEAGVCYLRSNMDKSKALPYLEKAVKLPKVDPDATFDLGLAYTYKLQFDKALKVFEKYKQMGSGSHQDIVDKRIASCKTAKQLMRNPVDVSFENVGPKINTPYPDYYPFVAKDESFMVFTSRRAGNTGGNLEFDGFFSSDIWISHKDQTGKFGKARNAGYLVNSEYDEQAVGLSDDANTMFVYIDKIKEFGDIYQTNKGKRSFMKVEKMGEYVNSSSLETAASISADGNTMFYASDKKDPAAKGNLDMYMTRKLPTGEWGLSQNISQLNSDGNEDFPTLSADGQTLYFCSDGLPGMGGYDIFRSSWDVENNTWSKPENLGYPLNTPLDERVISFSEDGIHAYMSALRKEGVGDLDIYRVTYKDKLPQAILLLKLPSGKAEDPYLTDVFLTVNDLNGNQLGDYQPNLRSGTFTIILAPGTYNLNIEAEGYQLYDKNLVITPEDVKTGMINKEITLTPN